MTTVRRDPVLRSRPNFHRRGRADDVTHAVREAWRMEARHVWLHTCTLDSPNALPAYKARGFRQFKTERLEVEIEGTQVIGERLLHQ